MMHKPGEVWDVHRDFLKLYIRDDFMGTGVPLYFHQGTTKSTVVHEVDDLVDTILGHRQKGGRVEFLVRWKGEPGEDSWEPATAFIKECSPTWLGYLTQHKLDYNLSKLFMPTQA